MNSTPMEKTAVYFYDFIKLLSEVGGFWGAISGISGVIIIYLIRHSFNDQLIKRLKEKDIELSIQQQEAGNFKNETEDFKNKVNDIFSFEGLYDLNYKV